MRENKKYKEIKVRCFKTGQNLYSEIFQNITEKELEKELNRKAKCGWDKFVIERTDKNENTRSQTLILDKSRLDTGSEPNPRCKSKAPECPSCRKNNAVIPIAYGFADSTAMDEADEGKIKLGGCVPKQSQWHCKNCKRDF